MQQGIAGTREPGSVAVKAGGLEQLRKVICTWVVVVSACGQPVLGCDLCAVYAATEAEGGSGKGFFGGVAEQYTYFNTLQLNGHKVPNEGDQYLHSSVSQVFVGYNFYNRLGAQFNLPLVCRAYGFGSARGASRGSATPRSCGTPTCTRG